MSLADNPLFRRQGMIVKPGRKLRIVYDGSYQHDPTCVPCNWCVQLCNEPEIVFGQAMPGHLMELHNVRVTHPTRDILQHANDVTRAFRREYYNCEVVPAKGFLFEDYLHFAVGQTFGDKSSPLPPN